MVVALIYDRMRPGMILFSVVILFFCAGILTPKEVLEGFSNKGMITVALLFLVSEGIRKSGVLERLIFAMLPQKKSTVAGANLRVLPGIAFISEQHAGGGYFCAYHQELGETDETATCKVSDSSFVCHYPWRYLYVDRNFYESGGGRNDTRCRF